MSSKLLGSNKCCRLKYRVFTVIFSPKHSEVDMFPKTHKHSHTLPAVYPEVSFSVTRGGPELSAPRGRALTAGGESHLHPPLLLSSPLLWRRSESREWKVRREGCFSPTLHANLKHNPEVKRNTGNNIWYLIHV